MQQYLSGELSPDDSSATRFEFWRWYQCVANISQRWLAGVGPRIRSRYRPWVLPSINVQTLSPQVRQLLSGREIQEEQQRRRKSETDAIVPLYPQLRAGGRSVRDPRERPRWRVHEPRILQSTFRMRRLPGQGSGSSKERTTDSEDGLGPHPD
jgi:hypothetical protein